VIYQKLFGFVLLLTFWAIGFAQDSQNAHSKTVAERLGYPADSRLLVIHAEDFGMAHSINRATIDALEKGWITSASILVPCPWFPEVARWAKAHPEADLGIRLDLNSEWKDYRWRPISDQSTGSGLVDAEGYLPLLEVYVAHNAKMEEVERETRAQIERATSAGIHVSHLDTHMRTLMWTPDLFRVYWGLGQKYQLPAVVPSYHIRERGTMGPRNQFAVAGIGVDAEQVPLDSVLEILPGIAKADWLSAYEKTLTGLPPGVYELSVHLGYNDEELQGMTWDHPNWGAQWRQNDLEVVSNPEFQKFLKDQKFVLVTWRELGAAIPFHGGIASAEPSSSQPVHH